MKKKLVYLFSILFTCVMLVGLFIFVLFGDKPNSTNEKILGSWKIVGSFKQGTFEYNENEFITFEEENFIYCKDNQCLNESYKINNMNVIELFEHRYHIDSKINEVMKLYEADDTYLILLRWDKTYGLDAQYDFVGEWNVLYKDTYINNMKLEFTENSLIQTTDDKTNTYYYEINKNMISVNNGQLNFIYIPLKDHQVVFVDTVYGSVWGLVKND